MKQSKLIKSKKRSSLFKKYYLAIAGTVIAGLLILGTIFSAFLFNYWYAKTTESLNAAAAGIAASVSSAEVVANPLMNMVESSAASSGMNAYAKANDCEYLITDSRAQVVKRSSQCSIEEVSLSVIEKLETSDKDVPAVTSEDDNGEKVLIVAAPITMGRAQIGTVYAIKQLDGFFLYIEDTLRLFIFSALGSLLISVAVAYYLVYRVYKPISQLKLATEKIGAGDYSFRVEIDGEDEFAQLGNAFNRMANELSALESSRRNFVANVSHELKTPMTTIGGYIDAIMDGTIDRDKQDHYLEIVSSEIKRLSRLVVAMLNLSKIEAGERKLEKKNVNLTALLVEVMISFEQAIENNHIEVLGLDKIGDVIANVDRDMIYQVFYNLTDNAVKFTDKGGRIMVSLSAANGKVGFRIINECSGITKEDISKIFERFYKVDRSRNLDVQGFGLGLYIAKTIVSMHGGQIMARSNEGSNVEFLFWIPAN